MGADCHGSSCLGVGTDHGTSLYDGPCWGSYAIYVSDSATTFACQAETLTRTKDTNFSILNYSNFTDPGIIQQENGIILVDGNDYGSDPCMCIQFQLFCRSYLSIYT